MNGTLWCLHGAVGRAADWRDLRIPGRAVKRVDLWRFLQCRPMSLAGFGHALNAEAAPTAGPRVLVGYSMGARLALHALLAGGAWDAAVLVAPHPGLEDPAERAARRESDAAWAARALSDDWRGFLAAWDSQPVLAGGTAFPDRRALASRRREVARSFIDWSLGAQEPLWNRLQEIACPVLWVVGARDTKFRALADRAVPLLPRGEAWIAAAAGHRVPWEAPEAFRERVGEFLERALS
jgi:2-succinyl-6-hydroxy-2,4-cyclohexadiene-1-carboxylate synthase